MIDLHAIAGRWGLDVAPNGAAIELAGARIAPWAADNGLLCVMASDEDTARAVVRCGFCHVVYRGGLGKLTATFKATRIGELIDVLSPDEPTPSYGRFRS